MIGASSPREFVRLLAVGGSDSSGGAGIQADLKTASLMGVECACAITAITAQNSSGVAAVLPVPAATVQAQMESVFADAAPHAVKLGMLTDAGCVEAVLGVLLAHPATPVVCDPVTISTSGRRLLSKNGVQTLLRHLPRFALLTPNVPEAAALSGHDVRDASDLIDAGRALLDRGARAVLLKGGHLAGNDATDILLAGDGRQPIRFASPRIATRNCHGTGCILASAIACGLAGQHGIVESIQAAREFLQDAMRGAAAVWNGNGRGGMRLHVQVPHS